jgi:hypothetical protein
MKFHGIVDSVHTLQNGLKWMFTAHLWFHVCRHFDCQMKKAVKSRVMIFLRGAEDVNATIIIDGWSGILNRHSIWVLINQWKEYCSMRFFVFRSFDARFVSLMTSLMNHGDLMELYSGGVLWLIIGFCCYEGGRARSWCHSVLRCRDFWTSK